MTPAPSPAERREELLARLRAAPQPLAIEELARDLHLKASTVRADLELLRASGEVDRTALAREGRGRPRWGYVASVEAPHPYEVLARALAHHIADDATVRGLVPDELAAEWLARIPEHDPAENPDQAVNQAARSLESLGFGVDVDPVGRHITMTGCPYADMVDDFPMICDVHGALLRGVLADADQGVEVERIDVWARPGMCVATLSRPDLRPERTIHAADLDHVTSGGGHP